VPFTRFLRFRSIARGPEDQDAMFIVLYTGLGEGKSSRGTREGAEGGEKERSLYTEKRRKWIKGGRGLSHYSSEDTSEQDGSY
jgi:hypothetical protein